jgi:proteasome-associated ATPase
MTHENAVSSTLRDLFQRRSADELDAHELLTAITRLLDANRDVREIMPLIEQLRSRADARLGRRLDQYFLRRIGGFERARTELESAYQALQGQLQSLMSPPFFPARFLGTVTTTAGEYAKVSQDGMARLVAFGEELGPRDFVPGDEVYLCHERNVVLAKAPEMGVETGETASVARRADDGCLVLNDRDTEVVVSIGGALASETLRPGDLVLWDRSARMALGRLENGKGPVGYEDIDATLPQELGGLDQLRESVLNRFVMSILYPDVAREYQVVDDRARRLLLIGPPGTGKTTLMRIVASRIARETRQRCRVVTIAGAELFSSFVGETERNIRRCFALLNDYEGPSMAVFDELDAVGRTRGHMSGYHDDRFLGTLLAELEGIRRRDVAVIAATNRADTLDPALRSRFAWELDIPRPSRQAAHQIFAVHMGEHVPYWPNGAAAPATRQAIIDAAVSRLYEPNADNMIASLQFRDGKRRDIAARELVSGRLIEQICAAARSAAFERRCYGGEPGVGIEDIQTATGDAIARLRNTLTVQNAKSYLADLPQDLDVVSVEAIRPRVDIAGYARRPGVSEAAR